LAGTFLIMVLILSGDVGLADMDIGRGASRYFSIILSWVWLVVEVLPW
jgi:hypothetical protein